MGSDDDTRKVKLVASTPERDVHQRRLEENVRLAFAEAAANLLEFVAGGHRGDVVESMRNFVVVHDAAEKETIDPKGVPIRMPRMERLPADERDPDDATNTIMRGALRMAAARLLHNAEIDNEDYEKANNEFAEGLLLFEKKVTRLRNSKRKLK